MSERQPRRGGEPGPRHHHRPRSRVSPNNPRLVALDVLLAVERDDAYANLLLRPRLREAGIEGPDAAFATELTYGTLRLSGLYDEIIEIAANRPIDEIDLVARNSLRLGAHQILTMRTKLHAAVNETVTIAGVRGSRGATGFVNAILRKISSRELDQWRDEVAAKYDGEVERLAALESHPLWIARALHDALGAEGRTHEIAAALRTNNDNPAVQLVALPGFSQRDELAEQYPQLSVDAASPVALQLAGGDPLDLDEVRRGTVRVQDAGSQLAALALSRVESLQPGMRILDLCAGPGGKTALLAAEAMLAGAEIIANEVTPARAGLVREALQPLTDATNRIEVTELDGREYADQPNSYDRVLVDAPCSGLGALRRRPEARWRKRASDIADLNLLQEELLAAAITATRPGGVVAYVTCSPHLAETAAIVRRVLRQHRGEMLDTVAVCRELSPTLDLAERQLGDGTVTQLWPHRHGTDAMFIALIRKPAK